MKDKGKEINNKDEYTVKYFFNKNAKVNINEIFKKSFLLQIQNYNK